MDNDYFKDWTVDQLADRVTVLERYRTGWDSPWLGDALRAAAFPNGEDPVNHPEDSLEAVSEALRQRTQGLL